MIGKELIEKIKQVTKEILFQSEVAETFQTAKLKDSEKEVKYNSLEVGSDVFISGSDGDEIAPDETYNLDNGVSFIVVEGKISEVVAGESEEEVEEELAVEEAVKEDEAKPEDEVENSTEDELKEKIAALEAELADLKSALESQVKSEDFSKLQNDVKAVAELLAAIANTPSEFSRTDNRIEASDSKNERLNNLASIISKK